MLEAGRRARLNAPKHGTETLRLAAGRGITRSLRNRPDVPTERRSRLLYTCGQRLRIPGGVLGNSKHGPTQLIDDSLSSPFERNATNRCS